MNELASTTSKALSPLESLAAEAQMYSTNARMNLFHLARVFSEARKLLPHGEWGKWVMENAGVEMRTAQQMIQSYERFGGIPALAAVDRTKLYKMNALPPGTEEAFIAQHDVAQMSTREVDHAVREFKASMQAEIDREREARMDAERRAEIAEKRPREIPKEIEAELHASRETIREQNAKMRVLEKRNGELTRDLKESQIMLEEQQSEIDRAQAELLNMQSAQARGDAERAPAYELSLDVFAGAVRQFVGTCARMPHMSRVFSSMTLAEKSEYDDLLRTMEGWCSSARKALDSFAVEGVIRVE